jgi:hypothetical protein
MIYPLYLAVKKRISEITEIGIKKVHYENESPKFAAPYVMIGFNTINTKTLLGKMQTSEVSISITLLTESMSDIDSSFQKHCILVQKIYENLQGFSATTDYLLNDDSKEIICNSIERTKYNPPEPKTNQFWKTEALYKTYIHDFSANKSLLHKLLYFNLEGNIVENL